MAPPWVSLQPPWVIGQPGRAAKGRITRAGPRPARAAQTSPSQAARCGPVQPLLSFQQRREAQEVPWVAPS